MNLPDLPFTDLVMVPCSMLTPLDLPGRVPRHVIATREDEALAIGAGLALAGRRPLAAMQNSGLFNSLNTFGSLVIAYAISLPILVSMRGGANDHNLVQMPVGRSFRRFMDAMDAELIGPVDGEGLDDALWRAGGRSAPRGPVLVLYEGRP